MADFKQKKIENKNLGDILKKTREKKNISIEDAEEETKVRAKYLIAFENGNYETLPGNVYAQGFLTKYVDFLGLNKKEMIGLFKVEKGESKSVGNFRPRRQIRELKFSITPKVLMICSVTIAVCAILAYIIYNVYAFTEPPNLDISSPNAEQIITTDQVNIIGKTDIGATLLINNQSILIDDNGNFSASVKLNQGLNSFEIVATNRLQKQTTKEVKILAQF